MNHIKQTIHRLYPDHAATVMEQLESHFNTFPRFKGKPKDRLWYKQINQYAVYPDAVIEKKKAPLRSLASHLKHVEKLGCNAIHILPFLDSPMIDKGFDVRSFFHVRKDLGSTEDLLALKLEAEKRNLHLFMDLVFNHVSDEHEWFQKALQGDEYYRNFFIHSAHKPQFIRRYQQGNTVWAEYHVDGRNISVHIVFPEFAGEIPHWQKGKDGYWYYHTFYPQQLDTNWSNPDVFVEYSRIVMHWAALGFNFRLDAIPFVGKEAYKQFDTHNDRTHTIIKALHQVAQEINPECVFVVETYEDIQSIIHYFGTKDSKQTELAYNFHLSTHMWASIVLQNSTYTWDKLMQISVIPEHAEWLSFLRNHDQLEFSYTSDWVKRQVVPQLLKNGAPFRGENDISGRTFSLLGKDEERFLMAYFLLASMPGAMAVPYGDEFGYQNIPLEEIPEAERIDTRNINRGMLVQEKMETEQAQRVFAGMSRIIQGRSILREYLEVQPKKLYEFDMDKDVFSAVYQKGSSQLKILINLTNKMKVVPFDPVGCHVACHVNEAELDEKNKEVRLGPYGGIWVKDEITNDK